ncbi:MAG: hypothetical protein M3P11_12845 [Actinomycetota bacterium]|nr:hypothetical protein [Actinomycetota bacterium]
MEITINLRGTPEDLRRFFAGRVGPLRDAVMQTSDDGASEEEQVLGLARDFSRVTERARAALRFIAEHAPTVDFDLVANHLGTSTRELSGSMSSYGRSAPAIGALFTRDYNRREYVIQPEAASLLLRAMTAFDAEQAGA